VATRILTIADTRVRENAQARRTLARQAAPDVATHIKEAVPPRRQGHPHRQQHDN